MSREPLSRERIVPWSIEEMKMLEAAAQPAPWHQMSGTYVSVDMGETPQVFRGITAESHTLLLVLRNNAKSLLAAAERVAALEGLLLDAWLQWSYQVGKEDDGRRTDGGLSTLEDIAAALIEAGILRRVREDKDWFVVVEAALRAENGGSDADTAGR